MTNLIFSFETETANDSIVEGLSNFMKLEPVATTFGYHVTTVEFALEDELAAHRLGKMISVTFPDIDYYVK